MRPTSASRPRLRRRARRRGGPHGCLPSTRSTQPARPDSDALNRRRAARTVRPVLARRTATWDTCAWRVRSSSKTRCRAADGWVGMSTSANYGVSPAARPPAQIGRMRLDATEICPTCAAEESPDGPSSSPAHARLTDCRACAGEPIVTGADAPTRATRWARYGATPACSVLVECAPHRRCAAASRCTTLADVAGRPTSYNVSGRRGTSRPTTPEDVARRPTSHNVCAAAGRPTTSRCTTFSDVARRRTS